MRYTAAKGSVGTLTSDTGVCPTGSRDHLPLVEFCARFVGVMQSLSSVMTILPAENNGTLFIRHYFQYNNIRLRTFDSISMDTPQPFFFLLSSEFKYSNFKPSAKSDCKEFKTRQPLSK